MNEILTDFSVLFMNDRGSNFTIIIDGIRIPGFKLIKYFLNHIMEVIKY